MYDIVQNKQGKNKYNSNDWKHKQQTIMKSENIKSIKEAINIIKERLNKAENSIKNQINAKEYLQNSLAELNKELWRLET